MNLRGSICRVFEESFPCWSCPCAWQWWRGWSHSRGTAVRTLTGHPIANLPPAEVAKSSSSGWGEGELGVSHLASFSSQTKKKKQEAHQYGAPCRQVHGIHGNSGGPAAQTWLLKWGRLLLSIEYVAEELLSMF